MCLISISRGSAYWSVLQHIKPHIRATYWLGMKGWFQFCTFCCFNILFKEIFLGPAVCFMCFAYFGEELCDVTSCLKELNVRFFFFLRLWVCCCESWRETSWWERTAEISTFWLYLLICSKKKKKKSDFSFKQVKNSTSVSWFLLYSFKDSFL